MNRRTSLAFLVPTEAFLYDISFKTSVGAALRITFIRQFIQISTHPRLPRLLIIPHTVAVPNKLQSLARSNRMIFNTRIIDTKLHTAHPSRVMCTIPMTSISLSTAKSHVVDLFSCFRRRLCDASFYFASGCILPVPYFVHVRINDCPRG